MTNSFRSRCSAIRKGAGLAAIFFLALVSIWSVTVRAEDGRVFELRKYTTHEGKLPELHQRFSRHTNQLFVKHGMSLIAYWTPTEGPEAGNTLIYILAYPSHEARDASWEGFRSDPRWQEAYKASTAGGKLVQKVESTLLRATDYSPIQ